jgi:hypothetical protein
MDTKTTTTSIEQTPAGLRIVMPVPRVIFAMIFLGVWLTGWAAGELSAIWALTRLDTLLNPASLFLLVWLTGWTCGGAFAIVSLSMMLDGREIVTFSPVRVVRRVEAFRWGLDWPYAMDSVTNLRQTGDSSGVKSFISFDASGKTVRFGTGLNETTAEQIAEAVWAQYPQLMPRVERVRRAEEQRASSPEPTPADAEAPEAPTPAPAPASDTEPAAGVDWA